MRMEKGRMKDGKRMENQQFCLLGWRSSRLLLMSFVHNDTDITVKTMKNKINTLTKLYVATLHKKKKEGKNIKRKIKKGRNVSMNKEKNKEKP